MPPHPSGVGVDCGVSGGVGSGCGGGDDGLGDGGKRWSPWILKGGDG